MTTLTLKVDESTKQEIIELLSKKKHNLVTLNIRVEEDTKCALEAIAKEKNRKFTELARSILRNYVNNYRI